jgi:hypothetical protein
MRKLRADEIECRVAQVTAKGCSLLLYKTARVDRAILDEEFGQFGWQNDFKVIDGKMYGGIGIYSNDLGEWLWRWDCGTESNTEAEKGQASDCFKRAGFKWGIGVELYTTPFIFVQCATVKDEYASKKAGKDVYKLADKYTKFEVTKIGYADNGDICNLSIKDNKGELVYEMGKIINRPVINPDTDIIEGLKACASYTELQRYYKANYEAVQDKKAFNQLATKLKAKYKENENG